MTYVRQRTAPIREKRLGSLAAWYGSAGSLVREADAGDLVQRIRTFAQDASSDLIYALELVGTLGNVAIVVHGPAGCAAALHRARGPQPDWIVTGINERDSILGGDTKLRAAILAAHQRFAPRAIVVVSSPVVIINNDDIDSVTEELQEELGVPVVPVYADGFRSKIAATGLDVVVHALIKHLLPLPETHEAGQAQAHVNLLSLTENQANITALRSLLTELGLSSVLFPRFARTGEARDVTNARLSVAVNSAESHYAGTTLHKVYGIPYIHPPAPIGLTGTAQWLSQIGIATGHSEQAERLIAEQTARLSSLLDAASHLRGHKVFLNLSADHAFAFWRLASELGLDVIGIKVPFLDPDHIPALKAIVAVNEGLPILVGEGQAFEEINLLRSGKPDLYIGYGVSSVHAARLGIATLVIDELTYLGFSGFENLLVQIERKLANTSFQRFLAEGETEPYTQGWRQKSAYWYIKHEVK